MSKFNFSVYPKLLNLEGEEKKILTPFYIHVIHAVLLKSRKYKIDGTIHVFHLQCVSLSRKNFAAGPDLASYASIRRYDDIYQNYSFGPIWFP